MRVFIYKLLFSTQSEKTRMLLRVIVGGPLLLMTFPFMAPPLTFIVMAVKSLLRLKVMESLLFTGAGMALFSWIVLLWYSCLHWRLPGFASQWQRIPAALISLGASLWNLSAAWQLNERYAQGLANPVLYLAFLPVVVSAALAANLLIKKSAECQTHSGGH